MRHPEIVKLDMIKSIEGIRKTITQRILPAFNSTDAEAKEEERNNHERYPKTLIQTPWMTGAHMKALSSKS